ncbi:glycosyl hydrolase [Paraburkholderia tropica]|uniref:glycosyl hydrolase n=1 Tax=Paraburkholderia tropica TaxID=92647 RepID=UPI003017636D
MNDQIRSNPKGNKELLASSNALGDVGRRRALKTGLDVLMASGASVMLASCGGGSGFSDSTTTASPPPVSGTPAPPEQLENVAFTVSDLKNRSIVFSGSCTVHVTSPSNPLEGATVNLASDNVWIFFDNILPSALANNLENIHVTGASAVPDQNVRLVRYLDGSVVISQGATFEPLAVYDRESLGGNTTSLGIYTYYKSPELAAFANSIASFTLRRGYMATFAAAEDGTGYSQVYIADQSDLTVNSLPDELKSRITFVRVVPWRWVPKKGLANGDVQKAGVVKAGTYYDWNNNEDSTLDVEYVPIRQTLYWPSIPADKKGITTLLGYNEPDGNNISVDAAVAHWPDLLATGLRLGTPAPTDGGRSWIYDFVNKCRAKGYRIDFVAAHFYWAHQSADELYSYLKEIHDNTGLPVWLTEFNNGANWTTGPDPTQQENADVIASWVAKMNETPWVERYFIYEWVEDCRRVFVSDSTYDLTPTGVAYRDTETLLAFDSARRSDEGQ